MRYWNNKHVQDTALDFQLKYQLYICTCFHGEGEKGNINTNHDLLVTFKTVVLELKLTRTFRTQCYTSGSHSHWTLASMFTMAIKHITLQHVCWYRVSMFTTKFVIRCKQQFHSHTKDAKYVVKRGLLSTLLCQYFPVFIFIIGSHVSFLQGAQGTIHMPIFICTITLWSKLHLERVTDSRSANDSDDRQSRDLNQAEAC